MPRQRGHTRLRAYPVTSLAESVRRHGGLAATFELYNDGHTRHGLAAAVRQGQVIRVRQGWIANRDIHPQFLQAARVGGRLTCLPGITMYGVWQYPSDALHIRVEAGACRLRDPTDMRARLAASLGPKIDVHWQDSGAGGSRFLMDPISWLSDIIRCQSGEVAITAADSALRLRVIRLDAWNDLLGEIPYARRRQLPAVEPLCESGIESLTRCRLQCFGLPILPQVRIAGIGRVDFLIGRKLVIEVDGAEYHTDPERFESDRSRDADLSRLGYRVLRFSYLQVMFNWPQVEGAILAAVFRGDHHD